MDRRTLIIGMLATAGCAGLGGGGEPGVPKQKEGKAGGGKKAKTGKAKERVGQTTWKMKVDGFDREAIVYVPDGIDGAAPLAVVLHGSKGFPKKMLDDNDWRSELDKRKWIGIFPATGHKADRDNDGTGDTEFILELLDRAEKDMEIDKKRIYVAGFSGGARSTYLFAAQHGDRLAAIGAGSGVVAMKEDPPELSDPRKKSVALSVVHVHGEKDKSVDLKGAARKAGDGSMRTQEPTEEALGRWVEAIDGKKKAGGALDTGPSRLKRTRWEGKGGKEVLLIVDPELGHAWDKAWETKLMCDFFEQAS